MLELFLFTPLIVALIFAAYYMWERMLDKAVERELRLTEIKSDGLGNYTARYNPRTGDHFVIRPGNPAWPIQNTYLMDGATPLAAPRKVPAKGEIKIYSNRRELAGAGRPELIESGSNEPELIESGSNEPELPEPDEKTQIRLLLAELKREGRVGKYKAIKELCGYSPGASQGYQDWSRIWDNL